MDIFIRNCLQVTFTDFTVFHVLLLKYGFDLDNLALLTSNFDKRSLYVFFNGTDSDVLPVLHDVLQESILRSIIFLIIINDMITTKLSIVP